MPRVSVLMPVFDSAPYLRDALESIISQTFADFELIVVNDGSTDGSSAILADFAREHENVRMIERSNRGLIDTRNQLLEEAQGEFIAWMDSDDLSHPDRLRLQVSAFDADPDLVCVGTNIQLVDPEGHDLGTERYPADDASIRREQAAGNGMRFASTMQRRSAALATGGFRHPFKMGEDFDFLLRVAEGGNIANLKEILYVYRQHLSNTCSALGLNWPKIRDVILELARERRDSGTDRLQRGELIEFPLAKPGDDKKLAPFVLRTWGLGARSAGDRRRAALYTMQSIRMAPMQKAGWRQLIKLLLDR